MGENNKLPFILKEHKVLIRSKGVLKSRSLNMHKIFQVLENRNIKKNETKNFDQSNKCQAVRIEKTKQ